MQRTLGRAQRRRRARPLPKKRPLSTEKTAAIVLRQALRGALAASMLIAMVLPLAAASPCCSSCGCQQACNKICRLVCETRKVTKIEYSCECEEFCVPGPSRRCRSAHCDADCDVACRVTWVPTCADVKTRKKLLKHEVTHEEPAYTWVIDEVCPACGHCARSSDIDPATMAAARNGQNAVDVVGDKSEARATSYAPPFVATLFDRLTSRRIIAE